MTEKYTPTIGLEIHAELKTKTKMFCDSPNDPDEKEPNKNICQVCTGQPGTLPVINKEAIRKIIQIGIALNGKIANFSEFDRKNYFYPDIPKGYQISQYKYPIVSGGNLCDVEITRVHLEEDTAKSSHEKGEYSLVDFNRAGIPLMELVTEPVIKSSDQAVKFARELQLLLRYLEASSADMEKGHMRIEANISVSKNESFGTKVEVKNLNSFRAVERAIEFEIKRQIELIESGGRVVQETRGWNDVKEETFSQRLKEESHDYRYFPEPDLPKLHLDFSEFDKDSIKKDLPELPWEKRDRYKNEDSGGLSSEYVEMFVIDKKYSDLFDAVCKLNPSSIKLASNYIASDIAGLVSKFGEEKLKNITPKNLSEVIEMIQKNKISSRGAKDILMYLFQDGGDPLKIAEDKKLLQTSDESTLEIIVEKIINSNEKVVEEYKSGKESVLQFLVGQGMKETKGSANPEVLKSVLLKKLSN